MPSKAVVDSNTLKDDLRDIRNSNNGIDDNDDVERRIEKLETQMEILANRLDAWGLDQQLKAMENEEDKVTLGTKTLVGSIPSEIT